MINATARQTITLPNTVRVAHEAKYFLGCVERSPAAKAGDLTKVNIDWVPTGFLARKLDVTITVAGKDEALVATTLATLVAGMRA